MRVGWWLLAMMPACSFQPGAFIYADGQSDVIATDGGDVTVGWSTPVKITEIEHAMGNDDPSLTDDLLQIYFGTYRSDLDEDIWFATRNTVDEPFGTPQPATELNTAFAETTAKITGNGKAIYFASNRVGNNVDIYVATRSEVDQPWSQPMRVDELSSANGDYAPFAQDDQLRLLMCSGPTPSQEAMYVATRASTGVPWSTPTRIVELDEPGVGECDPNEPRSNVLYYATSYLNQDGTFDIYRASRISSTAPYGNRTAHSINRPGFNDRDPWVSADERTIVFASDRDGVNTQIYITTRR
jgi:hypothetical protein